MAYHFATDSTGRRLRIVEPPRTWPDMLAHLASVPRLADLDPSERQLLAEAFGDLLSRRTPGKTTADLDRPRAFDHAHAIARTAIWRLLDGDTVLPSDLGATRAWRLSEGVVLESWIYPPGTLAVTRILVELLDAPSFPFGRCPECDQVFVRHGRQLYCSTACAARPAEAKRSASPGRREYMRKWMAERRRKERAAKAAEGSKPKKGGR